MCEPVLTPHPARYSPAVLAELQLSLAQEGLLGGSILDPFGGVGGIHHLEGFQTVAWEIEPEWAFESGKKGLTVIGDSRQIASHYRPGTFDAIVTSPAYGNRMADHHEAKDGSYRRTYRHLLGRPLSDGNSGGMQWGEEYRRLHREVYAAVTPLVRDGGRFFLNIKDHVRKGEVVPVADFHRQTLTDLGWVEYGWSKVATPGYRFGANSNNRQPEMVYFFGKRI